MTRICDKCKKVIKLGQKHIEVRFIGMRDLEKLFKSTELDFCCLVCLEGYWNNADRLAEQSKEVN